jgi:hypothetical protein
MFSPQRLLALVRTSYIVREMLQFPPEVWGPFFWHTIHIVALGYSVEPSYSEKKAAKDFYESLQFLIPCPVCREHYKEHLAKFPITPHLDRRKDLFRWTVVLHNAVNETLQKPTLTEQEALAYYVRLGKRERSPVWTPGDMIEADMRARLQGIGFGFAAAAVLGSLWYYLS